MSTTPEVQAAIQAIDAFKSVSPEQENAQARVRQMLNSAEAGVDIHELFQLFNILYFRSLLLQRVGLSWSKRMTASAGICEFICGPEDDGRSSEIRIKLSELLLKHRPRSDIVDTLLHESIHAYFFATIARQHARSDNGTGHGEGYMLLTRAINAHGGYGVTALHRFHDEVESYRKHIWLCDGPCKTNAPSFGFVKRAVNRPPGKSDLWWEEHGKNCGGTFIKIAEPEVDLARLSGKDRAGRQTNKIDAWLKQDNVLNPTNSDAEPRAGEQSLQRVGSKVSNSDSVGGTREPVLVRCPICGETLPELEINGHLDSKHFL